MSRKTATNSSVNFQEALDEAKALIDLRYELAKEAYDFQDQDTKEVIDRIRDRLRLAATGYISIHVNPPHGSIVQAKIEQEYVEYNLLFIATEILKDLAYFDIRVAGYKFPPSQCVSCGAELLGHSRPAKRKRRG